jgi:hypothetical protein
MADWALAWCLRHDAVTAAIPSCTDVSQSELNAAAPNWREATIRRFARRAEALDSHAARRERLGAGWADPMPSSYATATDGGEHDSERLDATREAGIWCARAPL